MRLFRNTHAQYEALVTEYLDGVLDAAGVTKLNEHLATCAECASEVKEQQAMLGILHTQPLANVPRSFALPYAPPVLASTERRVPRLLRSMQIATATAALVLVVLVGVNIAQGPSAISSDAAISSQQARTSEVDNSLAAKSDLAPSGAAGIAATPDDTTAISALAPNQPSEALTAQSPAPVGQEPPSNGRSGIEWALIVMSGLTGVLALTVVGGTWLPRRPI